MCIDLKMTFQCVMCRIRAHHLWKKFVVIPHFKVRREIDVLRPERYRINTPPFEIHFKLSETVEPYRSCEDPRRLTDRWPELSGPVEVLLEVARPSATELPEPAVAEVHVLDPRMAQRAPVDAERESRTAPLKHSEPSRT
jgi:hypothetical protein